jgi:hypothetical protein
MASRTNWKLYSCEGSRSFPWSNRSEQYGKYSTAKTERVTTSHPKSCKRCFSFRSHQRLPRPFNSGAK